VSNFSVKKIFFFMNPNTRKRIITAHDILYGKEPILVRDIMTSTMELFCNMPHTSEYIMIARSSVISLDDDKYANYCSYSSLKTPSILPQTLYNENNTVIIADLTGEKNSLNVWDRSIIIKIGDGNIVELHWIEWRILFTIAEVSHFLIERKGVNATKALSEINAASINALEDASSSGMMNQVFKSKNSRILATSIVGHEKNLFTTAINDLINSNDGQNDDKSGDNNNIFDNKTKLFDNENNHSNEIHNDEYKSVFFNGTRITGLVLLTMLIASVAQLNHLSRRKRLLGVFDTPLITDQVPSIIAQNIEFSVLEYDELMTDSDSTEFLKSRGVMV